MQLESLHELKEYAASVAAQDHPHEPPQMVNEFVQLTVGFVAQFGADLSEASRSAALIASGNSHSGEQRRVAADKLMGDEWLAVKIVEYVGLEAAQ